jgi:peroxiredoxin Q/BCP
VYGVSLDSVADQARFHEEQELNFPLLSDPDGSAATKYGVLPGDARWASRVTFVIDGKGILRAVVDDVKVNTHGEDLVLLVEELMLE